MSESIEMPKTKRVYKKKVATPIPEPVATPIPEPVAIPEPIVVAPIIKETPPSYVDGTPLEPIKKPRSQKQIEAFNRMREAKQKKKQETKQPEPETIPEPEPIIQINEPTKQKRTYKKKEPQQVYIDARTIHAPNPESYNEAPIYTQQIQPKIQEKTYRPYIFV